MSRPIEKGKQGWSFFGDFVDKLSLRKNGRLSYKNTSDTYDIFEIRQAFDWVKSHSEPRPDLENQIEKKIGILQESLNQEAIKIRQLSPYKGSVIEEKSLNLSDDFRQFSLLDSLKPDISKLESDLENPSTHLFAHLHLGTKALETGFEGESVSQVLDWANTAVDAIQNSEMKKHLLPVPGIKNLKKPMAQLQKISAEISMISSQNFSPEKVKLRIQTLANKIASSVSNLASGESYLMPGGYTAFPGGHAMYYRFTFEENGTFTVVLYNAGEGAQWQNQLEEKGVSTKTCPYVVFSGVTREELFSDSGKNNALFEALLKLRILPSQFRLDPSCRFGIRDVWRAFFPLHHRQIDASEYKSLFMTLQRSGTCSQKSLNACFLDLLPDPTAYKALNFNSQFLSLLKYYESHAKNLSQISPEMNRVRFQLQEATVHLFQKLLRYAQGKKEAYPELTQDHLKSYIGTLQELTDRLDKAERSAIETFQGQQPEKIEKIAGSISPILQKLEELASPDRFSLKQSIQTPLLPPHIPIQSPSDVARILARLVSLCDEESGDPKPFLSLIERFFTSLPVPTDENDPFWSKGRLNLELLQGLSKVCRYYIDKSTQEQPFHTLRQFHTVLSAYAVMDKLCRRYDKENAQGILQDYSIAITPFEELLEKDRSLLVEDPNEWERFGSLLDYFKKQRKEGREIFNYTKVWSPKSVEFQAEKELYGKIGQSYPNKKRSEHYLQVNSHLKFTDEELFAYDALREGWLPGTKNSYLGLLRETKNSHIGVFKQLAFDALVAFDTQGVKLKKKNDIWSGFSENTFKIQNLGRDFDFDNKNSSLNNAFSLGGKSAWKQGELEVIQASGFEKYFTQAPSLSEGEHLQEISKLDALGKRRGHLVGALCHRESMVSTLLYRMGQDPLLFSDPIAKALVQRILWRPYIFPEGKLKVPLFAEMKERPEVFLQQARDTINRGLQQSLYARSSDHADIDAALFFVQFAQQIEVSYEQIYGACPKPRLYLEGVFERLEQASRQKELPVDHLIAICLLRLNHLTATGDPKSWQTEKWAQIYQNWMLIRTLVGVEQSKTLDPRLIESVSKKMQLLEQTFLLQIKIHPNWIPQVLNGVSTALGIDEGLSFWQKKLAASPSNRAWKLLPHTLTFTSNDGITVNLSQPKVSSSDGELRFGLAAYQFEGFKKVFGEKIVVAQSWGDDNVFHDPRYGLCKILEDGGIQRKVGDSWYAYIPKELFEKYAMASNIPKAFYGGNIHWIELDSKRKISEKSRLLITDQESGKELFVLDQGKLISSVDEKLFLHSLSERQLTRFEEEDYILSWGQRVEMPRYRTAAGNSLAFVKKEEEWIYESDPNYRLEKAPIVPSLGYFSHFLLLSDPKKKRQKCLIPNQKMESSGFSNEVKRVHSTRSDWDKQTHAHSYFEFSIEEGELVAEGIDGWLMLAQVYLQGKDYIRAGRCLDKITLSDQFTKETKELFRLILLSGPSSKDYSPNACALRLRAFWILKSLDPLTKGNEHLENDFEHPHIRNVYHFYLRGLNSVYDPIKLTPSMEKALIQSIGGFEKRARFLSGQSWEDSKVHFKQKPEKPMRQTDLRDWNVDEFVRELNRQESDSYYPDRFLSYYTFFKNGLDSEQRKNLAYELQWRPLSSKFPNDRELLYFVYKYPEKCPKPVLPSDQEKHKCFFAQKLIEAFKEHSLNLSEDMGNFSVLSDPHKMEESSEKILNPVPSEIISTRTPLVSFSPAVQWDVIMTNIGAKYLEKKALAFTPKEFEVKCDFGELSETEKPYGQVIKNAFEELNRELKKGRKRLKEETPFSLKEGKEESLQNELEKFEEQMKVTCDSLEKEALLLCAKLPKKERFEVQRFLDQKGYKPKAITMNDLARIAIFGIREEYHSVAPHLTPSEIEKLHSLVLEYMTAKTTHNHTQRVLSLMVSASKQNSEEEKKSVLNKAAKFLAMQRQYEPEENISALFFDYVSGLRLRKEQTVLFERLIQQLRQKGSVKEMGIAFQMMQAGGKSSVILSRLMELLSDQGYLSIFVCHHSQMQSAIGNMKRYQRERFEKNVIQIDYAEDQLKTELLEHILNTLRSARKNKDAILMSSRFVQILEGRLLLLLKQRRSVNERGALGLIDEEIRVLQQINREMLENGVELLDEMDLSLNIFQQVNIPTGSRKPLPTKWISLVQKIFQMLLNPEVDKRIRLSTNEQSNFSIDDYYKIVVPEIGRKLIREVPALKLTPKQEGAFFRYLKKIDPKIEKLALSEKKEIPKNLSGEEKEDLEFLQYLHQTLRASSEFEQQEAAKQIALARGIVSKLLPLTLTKIYNRDYGNDLNIPGKTVPYNGVDSPFDGECGNVFEWLCYMFQSAANAPLSEAVIRLYAEKMIRLANAQISPKLTFEQTAEAEFFQKMTGISLKQIFEGDNLQKAVLAINQNVFHKLDIYADLAQEFVACHSEFIAMNPISMVDQFFLSIGTSGTLGNVNSYDSRLSQPILDEGAEGKILSLLLERFDGKGKEIKPVDFRDLKKCIETSLQLVSNEKNHCFIDGSGSLTSFPGGEVAREILDYFSRQPNSKIQGVVYYQISKEGKEGFVLLKKGASKPIPLEDITKEEIEKHGIPIDQIFYSLDELRATGTDPTLSPNANGVGTVNVGDLRKIGQMVMRLRDLFEGQDMQLVVSQTSYESVLGSSGSLLALIEKSSKEQAIQRSEETMRSKKLQISYAIRAKLKREILYSDPETASLIEKDYAPFFETTNPEDPFEMFGFSEENKTAGEILRKHKNAQLQLFLSCAKKSPQLFSQRRLSEIYREAENKMDEEISRAEKLPELQCLFPDTANSTIGSQVQVQIDQNILQQNQAAVSLQLDEELRSYQGEFSNPIFKEVEWNREAIDNWDSHKIGPQIYQVSTLLKDVDFDDEWVKRRGLYRKDYSSCFPSYVSMTENLQKTLSGKPLSFFHPLQKNASAVLMRKKQNEEFEAILLSQKDLDFWLGQKNMPKEMWLFNPNGTLLHELTDPLPEKGLVEESLWYVNFFNGNVPNLMRKSQQTSYFIQSNPLRKHFLALKTLEHSEQHSLLKMSPLFSEATNISMRQAEKMLEDRLEVEEMSIEQLKDLPPEKVLYVPLEKVEFLSKTEQIQALTAKQLAGLNEAQVDQLAPYQVSDLQKPELIKALSSTSLIKHVSLQAAQFLSSEQKKRHPLGVQELKTEKEIRQLKDPELISYIGKEQAQHVSPEQVPYLDLEVISSLRKKEQIQALHGKKQINAIGIQAVSLLSEAQLALLSNPILVSAVPSALIPYLPPEAVGFLDVNRQLPFLTKSQYKYISQKQYDEISEFAKYPQPLSKPLRPIWEAISPDALDIYKQMLGQVILYDKIGEEKFNSILDTNSNYFNDVCNNMSSRHLKPRERGETNWAYYLRVFEPLKEEDYLKVRIIKNRSSWYFNYIPIDKILKCEGLTQIRLDRCDLMEHDELFSPNCALLKLKNVDLIRCSIDRIPTFLKNCPSLEHLFINDGGTKLQLPSWLFEMKSLKQLCFDGCWVREIPPEIRSLENLESFVIRNSLIRTVPDELLTLNKLNYLEFNNNCKLKIPGRISEIMRNKNVELRDFNNGYFIRERAPQTPLTSESEPELNSQEEKIPPKEEEIDFEQLDQVHSFKKKSDLFQKLKEKYQDKMPRSSFAEWCHRNAKKFGPLSAIANIAEGMHRWWVGLSLRWGKWEEPEKIARTLYVLTADIQEKQKKLEATASAIANNTLTFESLSEEEKHAYLDWVQEVKELFLQEARKGNTDKILTNLFLDKAWIMNSVEEVKNSKALNAQGIYGMPPHTAAATIGSGLRKVAKLDNEDLPQEVKTFVDDLSPVLEQATLWSYLMQRKEGTGVVGDQFVAKLSKMKVGERLLLPVGTLDHNFLVQVHRKSETECDLTIVNTGAGLEKHPRFGDLRKFQTVITYQNIPFGDLENVSAWKDILAHQFDGSDKVVAIYDKVEKLVKNGEKQPASENILDYSTAQLQATCAAAPWWAWLRHEVVEFVSQGKEQNLLSGHTQWRILKNEMRRTIAGGMDEKGSQKIEASCQSKIAKHGQVCALLNICQDKNRFNQTIKEISLILKEATGKAPLFAEQDYDHYPNDASRWKKLHEIGKLLANELFYLEEEFREGLLKKLSEKETHLAVPYLNFLDLQQTRSHLEQLFQDAEKKGKWALVGKTLGRLALDPKLGPLAVDLAKKWLVNEKVIKHFLHFVTQGKGQERTLRHLAIYFRAKDKELAKKLWIEHRKYSGERINALISEGNVGIDDLELIEETPLELLQITSLIFAMRALPFDEKAEKLLSRFVARALTLDDENRSHLREVTQMLFNEGFDQMARTIVRLKNAG